MIFNECEYIKGLDKFSNHKTLSKKKTFFKVIEDKEFSQKRVQILKEVFPILRQFLKLFLLFWKRIKILSLKVKMKIFNPNYLGWLYLQK